jgi:hypothetical protein
MGSHEQTMEMAPNLMKERTRVLPDFRREFPGVFPEKITTITGRM